LELLNHRIITILFQKQKDSLPFEHYAEWQALEIRWLYGWLLSRQYNDCPGVTQNLFPKLMLENIEANPVHQISCCIDITR